MTPAAELIAAFTEAKWLAASQGNSPAAEAYHAAAELVAETFKGEPVA